MDMPAHPCTRVRCATCWSLTSRAGVAAGWLRVASGG